MAPTKPEFVHLHCHSEFSLLDGAVTFTDNKGKPSDFIAAMANSGFKAMGLTDHGNMFGAIEFYQACRGVGVKPIIGMEGYIAGGSRFDKDQKMGDASTHITLISKNKTGYQNLIKLSSMAYLEGFHYRPRIDKDILAKHADGLMGFTGCLRGEIPTALRNGLNDQAEELLGKYTEIFGRGNFYVELMDHGLEDQKRINPILVELAKKVGVPVVATNDCHYFKKEDNLAHDVLLCIGTGKKISEEKRLKFATSEFYYKSAEEMSRLFSWVPEAVRSTVEIAEKCEFKIDFDQLHLPRFPVPSGETSDSYLRKLCLEGLKKRKGGVSGAFKERLELELGVIQEMGFAPYFLIVWDFIRFARNQGIPVGPGRGSGAGSLVAYSLEITSIDPIENGLLFERFLNPDRRSMPDLDIDFSDEGRDQVIQYVRQKYGENCVAQIITFGSMLARGVVRDVGRVLEMPLPEVDRIAGFIPRELGVTIDSAMRSVPELRQLYKADSEVTKLLDLARKLEGLKRHTGVHAAGTLIAAGDITDFVPLAKSNKDVVITQYDGDVLGKLGMLKVDFLGLRTLTVIRDAVHLIRERHDPTFEIEEISLEDKKTYGLLVRADTSGVFQLESAGMRDLLRKLKPHTLSDITALISLYRPGPMGSGMLDDFVGRKNDPSTIKYDHELMKPILEETYGIIVYQEQVMRIARALADFTPGEADGLRKAMGKKIMEELEKHRGKFLAGAEKKGIASKLANKIFDLMAHFGGYGFNKSHASAYGLISYQTAFIKANYPVEFMAALCTSEIGKSTLASKEGESKLVGYLGDCGDMKIKVLPPDIQKSSLTFTVESPVKTPEPEIRFGLSAVKNVGISAVESILENRKTGGRFKSLEDFCARVDTRLVNRKVVESLVKAGAFDTLENIPANTLRPAYIARVETALDLGARIRENNDFAKQSLFGESEVKEMVRLPKTNIDPKGEWNEKTLLAAEKEVLGLYLSGHPLARYKSEFKVMTTHTLGNLPDSGIVRVAGQILSVRRLTTKRGNLMARFILEDLEGELEVTVFPKLLTPDINSILSTGAIVVVKGRVEAQEFDEQVVGRGFLAEEIITFAAARERFIRQLTVSLKSPDAEEVLFRELKQLFGKFPGACRVNFRFQSDKNGEVMLETRTGVKPSDDFMEELEKILGPGSWSLGKSFTK